MSAAGPSAAIGVIAAVITPALLILGSASLVASALVRMARIVDRVRMLGTIANEGGWERIGVTGPTLAAWLDSHARRAQQAERAIAALYAAVFVFVTTGLSIALDRAAGGSVAWLPISLAILGTLLLLAGGAWMVAESRLSSSQIQEEIRLARRRVKEPSP